MDRAKGMNRMKVWKYELQTLGLNSVMMPEGAEVLTVHAQQHRICLWAQHDERHDKDRLKRFFRVTGTGQTWETRAEDRDVYVGTAHAPGLVWHVFEIEPGGRYDVPAAPEPTALLQGAE